MVESLHLLFDARFILLPLEKQQILVGRVMYLAHFYLRRVSMFPRSAHRLRAILTAGLS